MQPTPADTPEPSPTDVAAHPGAAALGPFVHYPIPPELLAWARQTFDMQEYLEGVREIEATGGHSLESFIAEIEARVHDL